jgi:hypothetical protein
MSLRRVAVFGRTCSWAAAWALAGMVPALSGCGSDEFPVVKLTGKVTFQGQPVTGGSVVLAPIAAAGAAKAGKPASGVIQADGSFVLGTQTKDDGAVVGRHRVSYSPPIAELPAGKTLEPGQSMPPSPYDGLTPREAEVEVKKGMKELTIELVAPAGGAAPIPQ